MPTDPIDHAVPHRSSVPANKDRMVNLFVREYDGTPENTPPHKRRCVLMLHGRTIPVLAIYDTGAGDRSWAQELAKTGYDVFLMDLQGMGRSPRPEMHTPCNANPAHHARALTPNLPLTADCPVGYPHQLGNSQTDWDEVHTVVTFIKNRHGVDAVDMIGNSAAAMALGPYSIQYPDNVRSLMLQGPVFKPDGPDSAAGTDFGAPSPLPLSTPAAQWGFPMGLGTKAGLEAAWQNEVDATCPDQKDPYAVDLVWQVMMDSDDKGRDWGKVLPNGKPEGLSRQRNTFWWGWNKKTAPLHGVLGGPVPVCLVVGELDKTVTTNGLSVIELYKAVAGPDKLLFKVACASHQWPWEAQRTTLHKMSHQWLKQNAVFGRTSGSWYVDKGGSVSPWPV
ncbi:alpha/beta fold hydrolase [Streptomyces sp. NRRL S-87]|uniref:alpha/beta fold hydrolase n=1 Tax=Streptomyces sp. NRRL S-87 TaxID=1463920 RepID=UPI0004BE9994|nr:alpha/beta fold hydrolase [Streptomyces sp. NRRL S-87]